MRQPRADNFESEADSAPETAVDDRRRYPRAPHHAVFNVRPIGAGGAPGASVTVVLQDLSVTGMGIIHSAAMRVGDQYQIPLAREAGSEPLSLVATVVRCEQLDDGLFNIGFQFNSSAAAVDEGSRRLTGRPAPRE